MNLKRKIFDKKHTSYRIDHTDLDASFKLSNCLLELLPKKNLRPLVIVCIGSDRSTGDALGPLIGTKLAEKNLTHIHVYGTLDDPIHAVNLTDKISSIYEQHHDPFIIGIDACLGKMTSVGQITVNEGPLKPGAGVKKELPTIGEVHVTGIVNISGFMEYLVLQNTRLSLVMNMADKMTEGILDTDKKLRQAPKLTWSMT